MEKTIDGITFKEDNNLLLSKEKINAFLETHREDLKENNWDKILESVNFANGIAAYTTHLIYTLLFLNSDFMDYITEIPGYIFYSCDFITSITIPNSITKIGDSAFSGCSSLASITIPNSVTEIGEFAFYKCTSLTSITIPNSVTEIGHGAFRSCTTLASITIPDSVTKIGDHAFVYCDSLKSITIPSSVEEIGRGAFAGCTSLKTVTCSKDLKFNAKEIGLEDSVKIIKV